MKEKKDKNLQFAEERAASGARRGERGRHLRHFRHQNTVVSRVAEQIGKTKKQIREPIAKRVRSKNETDERYEQMKFPILWNAIPVGHWIHFFNPSKWRRTLIRIRKFPFRKMATADFGFGFGAKRSLWFSLSN